MCQLIPQLRVDTPEQTQYQHGDVAKKRKKKTVKDKLSILAIVSMTVCQKKVVKKRIARRVMIAITRLAVFCVKRQIPSFHQFFMANLRKK